ncbi:hypothetical protein GCM10011343_01510 [Flavobacterium orientale]|uniref:Tail specific protease domain-containing protein n=2 Tax=Flavobacterium orientale TaxID=1756020 RepID=A0A916XVP4_9FLAO|nr:hypothetical protein GCM10011343_01510 [Flavobacterium orientale]
MLLSYTEALTQVNDSVRNYIDSALNIMQTKALNGKGLDWEAIKVTAYQKAAIAKNTKEAFPALQYAFEQLKDYHGVVANADTFYRYPPPKDFSTALSPGIKEEFLKGNRIVTAVLPENIAYLRVPGMMVIDEAEVHKNANMLRDSLCMLLNEKPRGIIIDLRMNVGGNSAPMQSGIGPLFNASVLGYSVNRDGQISSEIRLKDGVTVDAEGNKTIAITTSCSASSTMPIAVLIGPSTVSSGEILAALLKAQPNVKLFGETTPGFCNATEGFYIMENKGYLLLSVSRIADATKHIYQEMLVEPHVYVKSDDNYVDLTADPTVKLALHWLGFTRE